MFESEWEVAHKGPARTTGLLAWATLAMFVVTPFFLFSGFVSAALSTMGAVVVVTVGTVLLSFGIQMIGGRGRVLSLTWGVDLTAFCMSFVALCIAWSAREAF